MHLPPNRHVQSSSPHELGRLPFSPGGARTARQARAIIVLLKGLRRVCFQDSSPVPHLYALPPTGIPFLSLQFPDPSLFLHGAKTFWVVFGADVLHLRLWGPLFWGPRWWENHPVFSNVP